MNQLIGTLAIYLALTLIILWRTRRRHKRAERQHDHLAFPLVVALLFSSWVAAQDVPLSVKGDGVAVVKVDKVITIKEDLTVVSSFPFTVQAPAGGGLYFWSIPNGVQAVDKGDSLQVTLAPPGMNTFSLKSISAKLDKDGRFLGFITQFGSVTFSVGVPTPPKPPEPKPDPKPEPTPSPISVPGLTVLVVYETSEIGKLPKSQAVILASQTVRQYLNAKCLGGREGYRFFDKDETASNEEKIWQEAMRRPRSSLPWIGVYNANSYFEGPLPGTVGDTLDLLKKHGGS